MVSWPPVEPWLVLPEVLDAKARAGGALPFADPDGFAPSMIGYVQRPIIRNTDIVKDGEITSYGDLLKPQYEDKIVLDDRPIAGGSNGRPWRKPSSRQSIYFRLKSYRLGS